MPATAIGIETTPSLVRAARLERSGGGVRLLAIEEVVCDATQVESLTHALIRLRQALRITQPVVLGLPGTSTILTTIHPLVVNPARAMLAVQFELQQQLPFELNEAVWHYHWFRPSNGHTSLGTGLRSPRRQGLEASFPAAVAAVIKRVVLSDRLTACQRAGLMIRAVAANAVATVNACQLQRSMGRVRAAALLNVLSDQAGEWIVWAPEHLEVIPVSSPSPEVFQQELLAAWQTIQARQPEFAASVWVAGASASSLRDRIAQELQIPVERFDPAQVLVSRAVRPEVAERSVTAIGLALQGLGLARLPLNLLSGDQQMRTAKRVSRAAIIISGICALAIVGFGLNGLLEIRYRRSLLLQSLEARERLYQRLRPDVRALLQRQQQMERVNRQLEGLLKESPVLPRVLAQVAEVLPDAVWLTKLECSRNEAVEGVLEGRAVSFQDVTQLFERLKSVAGMTTVKPLSKTNVVTDEVSGKDLITFAVQIQRPAK